MYFFSYFTFDLERLYPNVLKSKTLYISERIQLNWVEAFLYCQANGLRLAQPSSNEELLAITFSYFIAYPKIRDGILIDGSKVTNNSKCLTIDTNVTNAKDLLENVLCTKQTFKFLCESNDTEEAEIELRPLKNETQSRFLKLIGNKCESLIRFQRIKI